MSILSGLAIESEYYRGEIEIEPFDREQINPASYDLRLGSRVLVYERAIHGTNYVSNSPPSLDSARENPTEEFLFTRSLDLYPGRLYLMHTIERVCTRTLVPIVDGKSSIGRLGVFVHVTAGYGDPGFDGQYTLEVLATYPTRVYAGMRFCQIRFHRLEGEPIDYQVKGNYPREPAPVASRSWKQFVKKA